jgi:hypothetical protein
MTRTRQPRMQGKHGFTLCCQMYTWPYLETDQAKANERWGGAVTRALTR